MYNYIESLANFMNTLIDSYFIENVHDFIEWSCNVYQRTSRNENIFGVNPYEDRLIDY